MKNKYKILIGIGVLVLIGIFLYIIIHPPFKIVREIEVCNGTFIATANANPNLCRSGCIQYRGQFVPYDTLKYLQESVCKLNSEGSLNSSQP